MYMSSGKVLRLVRTEEVGQVRFRDGKFKMCIMSNKHLHNNKYPLKGTGNMDK